MHARVSARSCSYFRPSRLGRFLLLAAVFALGWNLEKTSALGADEPPVETPLHGETVVRLATVAEGARRLEEPDVFSRAMSRFDREVRLGRREMADEADVLRHAAAQVIPWSDTDRATALTALASLSGKLKPFSIPLPPSILLIQTNGKDEGAAAYCRYPAIIVPNQIVARGAAGLESLLCHELFHIISRHDVQLRQRLYRIVGFESCEPIAAPDALRDRKITNPDAPLWDTVIQLKLPTGPLNATPVLVASVERFDPTAGGTLFKYLQFRLLEVEPGEGGAWRVKLVDGQPRLTDPKSLDEYHQKIGKNTGYIIHPDEILADNFLYLVMGREKLPTPEIVERLRSAFAQP